MLKLKGKEVILHTHVYQLDTHCTDLFWARLFHRDLCKDSLNRLLDKSQLVDDSNKKIPASWKKITNLDGSERGSEPFLGNVTILYQNKPFDKPDELHIIGFEETTRSTWRYIFPVDYSPSLVEALGFKLKAGKITKIINKTSTDPDIRGTIVIENPAFQVDMQVHLE